MEKYAVLIVEDESIVAEHLADTIESNGYEVLGVAASGKLAIQMAQSRRPDVILMDVRIEGDLNGIETAIVIQNHFEEAIPVVFLTALPVTKFPVLAAVEPYIYVNKPVRDEDLIAALKRAVMQKN